MPPVARPLRERFNEKVDRSGGPDACHLWMSTLDGPGYGRLSVPGAPSVAAHRFSWEMENGPIPAGMWVLHRCDVRCCVNPRHLFLGTVQDNHDDMWAKGRGPSGSRRPNQPKGSAHHHAGVTEADVVEMRAAASRGDGTAVLARRFKMTPGNVRKIVRRSVWKHVG